MKITLNGKTVDVSKALPLQLGDLRRLKRDFDIDLSVGVSGDPDKKHGFYSVILQKANKDITAEDVDTLTLPQMTELANEVNRASETVDAPFSASSTS